MELKREHILVMIPVEELESLKRGQNQIIDLLTQMKETGSREKPGTPAYMTAMEFMAAVHIGRWKFDQLIAGNKIKTIKKKRKIYVPAGEVEKYFCDQSIR